MLSRIFYSAGKPWRRAYAAASVRLAVPVLVRMLRTCVATVLRLMHRASAMSLLLFPEATRRSTSVSRWLKPSGEVHEAVGAVAGGGGVSGLNRAVRRASRA